MRVKVHKRFTTNLIAALTVGIMVLLTLGLASQVGAQASIQAEESINQSEPVKGSFLGAGSTVQVTDDVDGDVYVTGQTVNIIGKISGDVLVLGQNVTVSGEVEGDVRVVAMSAIITGTVGGSLSGAIQNLSITNSASIGSDTVFAAQSAIIDGDVGRDVLATVEKLSVSGTIGRDISYISDQEVNLSANATVDGEVSRTVIEAAESENQSSVFSSLLFTILSIGFAVLIASIIMPRWMNHATDAAFPQPWKVMLAGLITIIIPILAILLMFSFIGIFTAFILLLAYGLLLALGVVMVSYYIGRLIFRNQQSLLVQSLVGALVFSILLFIPVVGILAWIFGGLIGTGIIALDLIKRISNQYPAKTQAKLATKKTTSK